jgi:antitoxin component of RelBE/YafQ-DinJ toxin-antitoxin module
MKQSKLREDEEAEIRMFREMDARLKAHRAALRDHRRGRPKPAPHPGKLDIDTTAYKIARETGQLYSFGHILPEVIANRDALRPDVRRYLLKRLRELAQKRRAEAERAIKKAQHLDEMVDRLAELEDAPVRKAIASVRSPEHPMEFDDEIARKAQAVLATTGVSGSAIVQMMFAHIAEKRVLPSELFEPNDRYDRGHGSCRPGRASYVRNHRRDIRRSSRPRRWTRTGGRCGRLILNSMQ